MGQPVFKVVPANLANAQAVAELGAHIKASHQAFYFVRVPADRVALVDAGQALGFGVVDVNVTLTQPGSRAGEIGTVPGVTVTSARPDHSTDAIEIAGKAFHFSRFHLDPRIDRAVADRVKREWIRSYTLGKRGDDLLVAIIENQVVGFLAALRVVDAGRRVAVIDLIAISADYRKRGVGTALIAHFIAKYRDSSDDLRVGTQVANVASFRLYQRTGFSISRAEYLLHLHS